MLRLAASVRYPDRSPCAENSPASNPANSTLCFRIALIDCGSIGRFETVPELPPLSTGQSA